MTAPLSPSARRLLAALHPYGRCTIRRAAYAAGLHDNAAQAAYRELLHAGAFDPDPKLARRSGCETLVLTEYGCDLRADLLLNPERAA